MNQVINRIKQHKSLVILVIFVVLTQSIQAQVYDEGIPKVEMKTKQFNPYGMFSYNLTKTISHINTPRPLNFTFTEIAYMISYKNNNDFKVDISGKYLVTISMLVKSANTNKRVQIWVRKNGVDVPRSNTIYEFKGVNQIAVVAVPFILNLKTSDNFQFYWTGDDASISCPSIAKTAYSPEAPCMIMTITKVSE